MEGFKHKIGDLVTDKKCASDWAFGRDSDAYLGEIEIISECSDCFYVKTKRLHRINAENIVTKEDIKGYALKQLAERMATIAGM